HRGGHDGRRPARRPTQSPLDQERRGLARRLDALRSSRLQQQCRGTRHGRRKGSRGDLGNRSRNRFASGLRNPVGLAWQGQTLWVAVNERDELGSDLVPDYMTSVQDGAFYGWPYSYWGQHVDTRVKPPRPDLVMSAKAPDYALGPHTASLGLAAARNSRLVPPYRQGMFVGQHGSWNRKPRSGYRVVFVPFTDGKPSGLPIDVLTGFVTEEGEAFGRPVGVAIDSHGALLVADDVGNVIWRVTAPTEPQRRN